MKNAAPKAQDTDAKPYVPTPADAKALEAYRAGQAKKGPRLKVSGSTVNIDYQASLKAIGSTDGDFLEGFVKQLVNVGSQGSVADESGAGEFHARSRQGDRAFGRRRRLRPALVFRRRGGADGSP